MHSGVLVPEDVLHPATDFFPLIVLSLLFSSHRLVSSLPMHDPRSCLHRIYFSFLPESGIAFISVDVPVFVLVAEEYWQHLPIMNGGVGDRVSNDKEHGFAGWGHSSVWLRKVSILSE